MIKSVKKHILPKTLTLLAFATVPAYAQAVVAQANTVKFVQTDLITVNQGDTFTVDLIGTDFSSGPDGVAFSLAWDPAVLGYINTTVANPPWDVSSVTDTSKDSGILDFVFLGKSVGDAGANFAIASFSFNVLGNNGSSSTLTLSIDPYNVGFVAPGAVPIAVNYVNSLVQVQTVPVPAAAWLFGSALIGFFSRKYRPLLG